MFTAKQKFNRTSEQVLGEVSALAHSEGKPVQALIDEALSDLIEKRKNDPASSLRRRQRTDGVCRHPYVSGHQRYSAHGDAGGCLLLHRGLVSHQRFQF
jgi:hypothetical protein